MILLLWYLFFAVSHFIYVKPILENGATDKSLGAWGFRTLLALFWPVSLCFIFTKGRKSCNRE